MPVHTDPLAPQIPLRTKLLGHLYNPNKLRAIVTGLMLAIGYIGVYMPLSSGMETASRKMAKDQKRLELGCEVEQLRTQFDRFKDRIPKKRDPNEWVEYILDGIHEHPVDLLTWNQDDFRDIGPYKVIALKLELEGTFAGMDSLLNWLETNERLIRIDNLKLVPQKGNNGKLKMTLMVLGVMG